MISNITSNPKRSNVVESQRKLKDRSDFEAFGKLYGPNGTALSFECQRNVCFLNNQSNPIVAMDSTGNFTTAWTSSGHVGNAGGVFGKRFDVNVNARIAK